MMLFNQFNIKSFFIIFSILYLVLSLKMLYDASLVDHFHLQMNFFHFQYTSFFGTFLRLIGCTSCFSSSLHTYLCQFLVSAILYQFLVLLVHPLSDQQSEQDKQCRLHLIFLKIHFNALDAPRPSKPLETIKFSLFVELNFQVIYEAIKTEKFK